MSISGLITIATGQVYRDYAKDMLDSAAEYFTGDFDPLIFTDEPEDFGMYEQFGANVFYTAPKGYPNETLYRYNTMLQEEKTLCLYDHLFYVDADMLFTAPTTKEIFHDGLVATLHPGYASKNTKGDCETRPASTACCTDNFAYYAGGFQGGQTIWYLDAARAMKKRINEDTQNNIVAKWHDESHWNRFISDAQHLVRGGYVKVLTPSYCYPEDYDGGYGWSKEQYPPILVALEKRKRGNHPRFK